MPLEQTFQLDLPDSLAPFPTAVHEARGRSRIHVLRDRLSRDRSAVAQANDGLRPPEIAGARGVKRVASPSAANSGAACVSFAGKGARAPSVSCAQPL